MKVPALVNLVKEWEKAYEEHNMFQNGLRYFVFNDQSQHRRGIDQYTEFSFQSGKNFSNVFFPEKDELMKKIQFFSENESWYVENGIPYMFGLLLHGEPGCGKTSTIKAIANMTQRHIGNWLFSAPFDSLIIGCNFRIQSKSQKLISTGLTFMKTVHLNTICLS